MSVRPVKRVTASTPATEGAGVKLHRGFGFGETSEFDPFLLFDDFRNERPGDYLAGFPWHPHRGIETITYVLAGTVDLMMGARQPEPGSWPVHARLANHVLAFEIRRRTKVDVHDLGPMRAVKRTELLALGMTDRRSGCTSCSDLAATPSCPRERQAHRGGRAGP